MRNFTEEACQDMDALADRLFEAIEGGDIDALEQIYAPDVEYRMNFSDQSHGLATILELTRVFNQKVRDLHYEVESRDFFPGGFVQRGSMTGEQASGEILAVPLCLVIYVEDGRIGRLYEYLDPASLMPALGG